MRQKRLYRGLCLRCASVQVKADPMEYFEEHPIVFLGHVTARVFVKNALHFPGIANDTVADQAGSTQAVSEFGHVSRCSCAIKQAHEGAEERVGTSKCQDRDSVERSVKIWLMEVLPRI